ncbi:hypothetical protein Tco_1559868, partial [Tanacetum coccineum]
MSKMHSWTWDELVVSVQCLSSNPSLPLFLLHHLTIHGVRDFVCCQPGKVIGVMGRWEMSWEMFKWEVSKPSGSWVVFAVRVQYFPSNPSPPFTLNTISPLKGVRVFVNCQVGMGYKVGVSWEVYGEAIKCTMEVVWQENSG